MARLALTPTVLTGAATPVQITDLISAGTLGTNTGVSFTNSGRELLVVTVGTASSTCTANIGSTVEGQSVTAETPTLTSSKTHVFPAFPRDFNQPAGTVFVDFGTPAAITVTLLQFQGVV